MCVTTLRDATRVVHRRTGSDAVSGRSGRLLAVLVFVNRSVIRLSKLASASKPKQDSYYYEYAKDMRSKLAFKPRWLEKLSNLGVEYQETAILSATRL